MILAWMISLGLLQIVWSVPVTQTDDITQPSSRPIPPLSHGQECAWCAVIDPTAPISALCESCRTVDETMSKILENPEETDKKRKATTSGRKTSDISTMKRHAMICPDHNTGKPRTVCVECQKNGTGGGALCKGGHGKRKTLCKECHPDIYTADRLKRTEKQREKRQLKRIIPGSYLKDSGDSDLSERKCACGNEIENPEDPLCAECAADLYDII